jgi:hypothetical protein
VGQWSDALQTNLTVFCVQAVIPPTRRTHHSAHTRLETATLVSPTDRTGRLTRNWPCQHHLPQAHEMSRATEKSYEGAHKTAMYRWEMGCSHLVAPPPLTEGTGTATLVARRPCEPLPAGRPIANTCRIIIMPAADHGQEVRGLRKSPRLAFEGDNRERQPHK